MNRSVLYMVLTFALAGCGADVASTAATQAALEAQEAQQAQQIEEQVQVRLDAAMHTEQQRLQRAEKAAGY